MKLVCDWCLKKKDNCTYFNDTWETFCEECLNEFEKEKKKASNDPVKKEEADNGKIK